MTTYTAIRRIRRALAPHLYGTDLDWRSNDAVVHEILRHGMTHDLADEIRALDLILPTCACTCCGCLEDAEQIESDGGEAMCAACCDYATDEDGEVVCSRDERYVDDGEWTGGGMHGSGTAWVSRPRVRQPEPEPEPEPLDVIQARYDYRYSRDYHVPPESQEPTRGEDR